MTNCTRPPIPHRLVSVEPNARPEGQMFEHKAELWEA